MAGALCKKKNMFLKCKACVLSDRNLVHVERTRAPVDSIEVLVGQTKHLKGTGASTSLKSIVSLIYVFVERKEFDSVRRNSDLVLPAA